MACEAIITFPALSTKHGCGQRVRATRQINAAFTAVEKRARLAT